MGRRLVGLGLLLFLSVGSGRFALAQFDFDREPIQYRTREPSDRIHALSVGLVEGTAKLEWDEEQGWLPSLLATLRVPRSSQTLVFSQTSLQFRRITPSRPRAVYFSDDAYLGWVPGGSFIELAAVDPEQGAVFYTIDQKRTAIPVIKRDPGECMICHATQRTQDVPGFLVRSVYTESSGQPDLRLGSVTSDHTTPFSDRFGGWYVTGTHGDQRHRGNVFANGDGDETLDREAGANRTRLPERVRVASYLEPTSDIVALMLLEHQTQFHNRVTQASYSTRTALHQQQVMNRLLERPESYRSEGTTRRIHAAAEAIVEYLLFCDECPLTAPVRGGPTFRKDFAASAVRDRQGRSLRDLDLERRLLRYPCSYLIYTDSFRSLPDPVLTRVKTRLNEVLAGTDSSDRFTHLTPDDRRSIAEILAETHPLFRNSN